MANSSWLRMKKIIFSLFPAFTLVSCVNQSTTVNITPTNNFIATSTSSRPVMTFTPIVTATPISSDRKNLDIALISYLSLSESCQTIDRLSISDPKIIFSETKQGIDDQKEFVSEIAKSANNKYSAYIAQHYALDIMSGSMMPIYCEGCGIVYLENIRNGEKYEISWNMFPPGISMIYSMLWIDDNILVVREAQSEDFYYVLGIDVENQKAVYFSEISCINK